MKPEDEDRYARGMARLMLATDKKLTEARIDLYWERLKDVPIEIFEEAIPILIDQVATFPRVPIIRRACDEAERRRKYRASHYLPDPDREGPFCSVCEDTGWKRGRMWVELYGKEVDSVTPCACRKGNPVWRAKLGAATNAVKPEGRFAGRPLFD